LREKKLYTPRPMKLREYSPTRERVRCPTFIEIKRVVDAKTDETEGILTH
jgi:hypothetical protein